MSVDNSLGEEASAGFEAGLYCAESVLKTIADHHKIDSPLIPRMATGFCSGMARTCGTCGAVSGAILAINLVSGRDRADQSVEENYALVTQLVERFRDRFGSTMCDELLGCDLGSTEGMQQFQEQKLWHLCKQFTADAAMLADEILRSK